MLAKIFLEGKQKQGLFIYSRRNEAVIKMTSGTNFNTNEGTQKKAEVNNNIETAGNMIMKEGDVKKKKIIIQIRDGRNSNKGYQW